MNSPAGEKCSKCGYELTGLRSMGQCPECGSPYDKLRRIGVKSMGGAFSPTRADETINKAMRIGCGTLLGSAALGLIAIGALVSYAMQDPRAVAMFAVIGGILAMASAVVLMGLRQE